MLLKEETAPERGSASGGLAARHSEANNQATLVERKFALFQMLATGRGRWRTSVQRPTSPHTTQEAGGDSFYRQSGVGGYMQKQHSQL